MSRGFEVRESWTVDAPRDRVHTLLIDLTWNRGRMMAGCLTGLRQRTASAAS